MKRLILAFGLLFTIFTAKAGDVLIVADEFPAMEVLAAKLKADSGTKSEIVAQTNMPANLTRYQAVIVYIHGKLLEGPENAFVRYTERGGKLIALHHSISSGKRKNAQWFAFLNVKLPEGPVQKGGYQWTEGVSLDIVNLAPNHYITKNKLKYPKMVKWPEGLRSTEKPGFTLEHSEVYLNHVLTGTQTVLLGLRYRDEKTGTEYKQAHAGWFSRAGQGWIVYLMPGHSVAEFKDPHYAQIVANAVTWKP